MGLKFAANLNFLFTEGSLSIAEKIRAAHLGGFRAVEIPSPATSELSEVVKAKQETNVVISLINIAHGTNKFGSACIPGAEDCFKAELHETIRIAQELNCSKVHIMSGLVQSEVDTDYLETYKNNLKYAAACLKEKNMIGVIEPINKYALPNYFMNSYETACSVLRESNSNNLKLMLDIFHLQHIRGNITNAFKDMSDLIGHIQIAQVPHRNEPDTIGEINFEYVLHLIEEYGYKDWIGCEYKPKTTTLEGLKWFSTYGLQL